MSNAAPAGSRARLEWPTLALAAAIYGGWLAATAWHDRLPAWMMPLVGGWLIAWHGSLQHETIHGHPTGMRSLNALIGAIPLSLWLPYGAYRRTHIAHHDSSDITDPFEDPESRYFAPPASIGGRLLLRIEALQSTLAGRLLLGPPLIIARFLAGEIAHGIRMPRSALRTWLPHLAAVALILWWLDARGFGIGRYLLTFVYPGTALSLLRSFAEHRADPQPQHRVAIVEQAGPFAWLFLHNNLHAAHHHAPGVAWFRLPAYYRRHRDRLLRENGDLLYRGYGEVARRYLFRGHDRLIHPAYRPEPSAP